MTNHTPHGQVPEALIDLIDEYAETRHRYGGIYNAKTEAARKAVIEALSGVQALSAASQPPISNTLWRMLTGGYEHAHILQLPNDSRDRRELIDRACRNWRRICAEIDNSAVASAVSPQTAQAPQQAAPKAAPGEPSYSEKLDAELGRTAMRFVDRAGDVHPGIDDAETICAEFHKAMSEVIERMPHVQRMAAPQQEAQEPAAYVHVPHHTVEGKVRPVVSFEKYQQDYADGIYSTRIPLYTAPQPAPAPLSDDVVKDAARYRWLRDVPMAEWPDELVTAFQLQQNTIWDAAIDAAIAAHGGK